MEPKRRKRASMVCDACRRKKIRCDKLQPCSQCVKAGCADDCVYDITFSDSASGAQPPYVSSAKNPITFESGRSSEPARPARAPPTPVDVTKSELEMLKERLRQLEETFGAKVSPPAATTLAGSSHKSSHTSPLAAEAPPDPQASSAYVVASAYAKPPIPPLPPGQKMYTKLTNPFDVPVVPPALSPTHSSPVQLAPLQWGQKSTASNGSAEHDTAAGPGSRSSQNTPIDKFTPGSTTSTSTTAAEVNSLNGMNPYRSPDDAINFYDGYTSVHVKEKFRRLTFGPFAWSSLMKKDMGLKLLWDYTARKKEQSANTALIFSEKPNELTQEVASVLSEKLNNNSADADEKFFKRRALQPDGASDLIPYNKLKKEAENNLKETQANTSRLPLGLIYMNGKIERELQLIDKIQLFMPPQKVVWMLVDRFFIHVYPFMPFIDENSFRKDLHRIIGEEAYVLRKIENIRIERRLDLAQIGVLFLVLRLSYLALFSNSSEINEARLNSDDPSLESKKYRYLLSNPISINLIDIAQECLDEFDFFRQPAFLVLQLALYLRQYHTYAPEDGDGADGGDSHIMIAVLIRMATSLGLHREPDNFPELADEQPMNHLGRKIWYHLIACDTHLGYSFGSPLIIDADSYDTKIPFIREGNETLQDTQLDRFITESYFDTICAYRSLRTILGHVLKVQGKTKMSFLCNLLTNYELEISKEYGTLAHCIHPSETDPLRFYFTKTLRTKVYLALKAFFISIYFYFYQYYEPKNIGLSFFYIKKILLICVGDIMPHFFDLINSVYSSLMFNPTFEAFIHKANQVIIALIARVNFNIYNMKIKPDHDRKCRNDSKYLYYYKSLCRLSSALTRCLEISIATISKISNRYYYAWRITKGHTYLLRSITKKEFYEENYLHAGHLCTPLYSIDQIEDLVNICEQTLTKLGKDDKKCFFKLEVADAEPSPTNETASKASSDSYIGMEPTRVESSGTEPTSAGSNGTEASDVGPTTNKSTSAEYVEPRPVVPQTPKNTTPAFSADPALLTAKTPQFTEDAINFDLVDNAEIDKLWLAMLSFKQVKNSGETDAAGDSPLNGATPSGVPWSPNGFGSPAPSDLRRQVFSRRNSIKPSQFPNYAFDQATVDGFDIFSEIPYDQIFNDG